MASGYIVGASGDPGSRVLRPGGVFNLSEPFEDHAIRGLGAAIALWMYEAQLVKQRDADWQRPMIQDQCIFRKGVDMSISSNSRWKGQATCARVRHLEF